MKCAACDCDLSDFESTRKSTITGEYVDLCANCFSTVSSIFHTSENFALFDETVDSLDFTDGNPDEGEFTRLVEDFSDDYIGGPYED